ncbi:MAG: hypothetical protein MUC71_10820 [Steroidobacteraceae bacterium]|jgi:hypothetical protein|nr:hypothetical protein [Steroidobacteraceae bacterium]
MRIATLIAAGLLASVALPANAQAPAAEGTLAVATEPGRAIAVATVEVSATVKAIDKATRDITLEDAKGKASTVTAGPEVRNFDQIAVGDIVTVNYLESLELQLLKGHQAPVQRQDSAGGGAAELGQKPAAGVAREVHAIGNVVAVDAATQTITVEGPQRTVELKLQDPEQFKLVEVGDQVEATYTQALAISVEAKK